MNKKSYLATPYLLWTIIFTIVPLFLILYFSFSTSTDSFDFTLKNYKDFFVNKIYLQVFMQSVLLSVYATIACLLIAYPCAYFISQKKSNAKNILLIFILLPLWTNFLLRTYAWMNLLRDNGLFNQILMALKITKEPITMLNTTGAVLMGMVYNFLPFMILPIYTVLNKMDKSYVEAAMDLGANKFYVFTKVIIPLSMPGVISGIIMVFMPAISTFVISDLLGGGRKMLLGNLIQNQFLAARNWQFGSALSMILIAIILISMLFLNKYADKSGGGRQLW